MKTTNSFLLFIIVLIIGCDKSEINSIKELTDGFCIVANDEIVLNHNDIEYYDYSNHLIYMKSKESFPSDIEEYGTFTVFADRVEIYSGQTFPPVFTILSSKPAIFANHSFYGDYIIHIKFMQKWDTLGNIFPDPREDIRIVEALKKHNQFHSGLNCEINSVEYLSEGNVTVELKLINQDSFNYYYLDPDKMGINLFHYFTNGLSIRDFSNKKAFHHKIEAIHPDPWNSWKKEWLSLIKSNETKNITITYESFENVAPGEYKATFEYPGLSFQVEKKDIEQDNGLIWLGELNIIENITIE